MIRSSIFNILFYALTFVIALTVWLMTFVTARQTLWYVLRFWGLGTIFLLRVILGARVEVRGRQYLAKDRPQVLVSKHQSELDIVMLAVLMWDISAIAMEELTKLPFFGRILNKMDVVLIAVDGGPQGRTAQAIQGAQRMKQQGRSMVIYPEGELMKVGAKERYRRGAAHVYGAMEVEAVPMANSLGVVWPRRDWLKTPGATGAIEFLEPIPPGMDPEPFMAEVENRIETRTMELIEEHAKGQMLEDARDRKARGANNERDAEKA